MGGVRWRGPWVLSQQPLEVLQWAALVGATVGGLRRREPWWSWL